MPDNIDPILLRIEADVSQFRAQMQGAGGDLDKFSAKTAVADKEAKNLDKSLLGVGGSAKQYAAQVKQAYGLTDDLTASQARYLKGLYDQQVASRLAGAEAQTFIATQRLGVSVNSELGQAIAAVATANQNLAPAARVAAAEMSGFGEAAKGTREAIHTLHPVLATAGAEIAGLGAFATVARAGFAALAAAAGGAFVIALQNAGDRARLFKQDLAAIFGEHEAEHRFEELEQSAKKLGTSIEAIAPAAIAAESAIKQIQLGEAFDVRQQLEKKGFKFVDSNAGNAALQDRADRQKEIDDLKLVADLYQSLGVGGVRAKAQADQLFSGFKPNAEAAKQAAEDVFKTFQVGGARAEDAKKGADEFFATLAKGKLTIDDFMKLPPVLRRQLADAFNIESVDEFIFALGKVPVSASVAFKALENIHPQIEQLEVKPTIGQSWDNLTASVQRMMEAAGSGIHIQTFFNTLAGWMQAAENGYKHLGEAAEALHREAPSSAGAGINATELDMTAGAIGLVTSKTNEAKQATTEYGAAVKQTATDEKTADDNASGFIDTLSKFWNAVTSTSKAAESYGGAVKKSEDAAAGLGIALNTLNPALDDTEKSLAAGAPEFSKFGDAGKTAMSDLSIASTTAAQTVANNVQQIVSTTQAAIAKMQTAATATGGGGTGENIQIPQNAPGADIGLNALGGIYSISSGGGTDNIRLTGRVTAGETVAIIPPGKASASLLQMLSASIGNSPIKTVRENSSSPTTITAIASPDSYAAAEAAAGASPALLPGGHFATVAPSSTTSSFTGTTSAAKSTAAAGPTTATVDDIITEIMNQETTAAGTVMVNIGGQEIPFVRTKWGGWLPQSTVNITAGGGLMSAADTAKALGAAQVDAGAGGGGTAVGSRPSRAAAEAAAKFPGFDNAAAVYKTGTASKTATGPLKDQFKTMADNPFIGGGGRQIPRDMGPLYDSKGTPLPQTGPPEEPPHGAFGYSTDSLIGAILSGKDSIPGFAPFVPPDLLQQIADMPGFPDMSLLDAIMSGSSTEGFAPFDAATAELPYGFQDYGGTTATVADYGTFTQEPASFSPEASSYIGGGGTSFGDVVNSMYQSEYDMSSGAVGGGGDYSGGSDYSYIGGGDFATGGRFTVPRIGGAGMDKVPVRMNVTPGEEVSVAPINRRPWDGDSGSNFGAEISAEVRKIGGAAFGRAGGAEALHFHIYGDGGGSSGALPKGMSRAAIARDFRRALAMA